MTKDKRSEEMLLFMAPYQLLKLCTKECDSAALPYVKKKAVEIHVR
jgi:hypothetical protein